VARPTRLSPSDVDAWIAQHRGWEGDDKGITKRFTFPDFSSALAFVVRVGCLAEKKNHHPDIELTWGRCRVAWSTHDAGGVTELDLAAGEATDSFGG
jgi:4a-hydroxytetrahydrobiopterin dehydratase